MNPLVKWAGGKRQIINKLKEYMPREYNKYFEPFIGGGALLLELAPDNAVINDVNQELLAIYKCLQDDELFKLFVSECDEHQSKHSEEYYYAVRSMDKDDRFELLPIWKRAARALYLNKSCFNGLYRVNSKGYFNVPSGKKDKVNLYEIENINSVHNYFMNSNIEVLSGDFVEAVRTAKKGDFVYFDSPYDTWKEDTFTAYSKFDFTKDDQVRLADCFKELSKKGVKCMLSNHNTKLIQELYKDFNIHVIAAKRMINSKASGRGEVEEVIITNYEE